MSDELERFRGAVAVTAEIGEGLNKTREQAKVEAERARGGKDALMTFHQAKIGSVHKVFDKAVDDGLVKLEGLTPLQIRSLVKEWVTKVGEAARNYALYLEREESVQRGKVLGLDPAIQLIQNHHNVAVARARQLEAPKVPQDQIPSTAKATGRRSLAEATGKSKTKSTKKRTTKKKKRTTKKKAG